MFELHHGEFYSLFRDCDSFFWVMSNKFSLSVHYGPFSSLPYALSVMGDANHFMNAITCQGVVFYD